MLQLLFQSTIYSFLYWWCISNYLLSELGIQILRASIQVIIATFNEVARNKNMNFEKK